MRTITGDAPQTATAEARSCIERSAAGAAGDVTRFQDVLERHPDNLPRQLHLPAGPSSSAPTTCRKHHETRLRAPVKRVLLDCSIEADRLRRRLRAWAVLGARRGLVDDAAADLDRLDDLNPPASVKAIVAGLRRGEPGTAHHHDDHRPQPRSGSSAVKVEAHVADTRSPCSTSMM